MTGAVLSLGSRLARRTIEANQDGSFLDADQNPQGHRRCRRRQEPQGSRQDQPLKGILPAPGDAANGLAAGSPAARFPALRPAHKFVTAGSPGSRFFVAWNVTRR